MVRTWVRGRRGAAVGAACATVACLGAVAAFGGGAGPEGYVAVGTGGGTQSPSTAPSGEVRLVPLDPDGTDPPRQSPTRPPGPTGSPDAEEATSTGGGATGPGSSGDGPAGRDRGSATGQDTARGTGPGGADEGTRTGSGSGGGSGSNSGGGSGTGTGAGPAQGTTAPAPPGTSAPASPAAPGPAALNVGDPVLQDADKRWCQKVTLALRNSGGSAVRSGTVTFRTHIIGSLGVDWATIASTEKLPVPIGAGEEKKKTWTVCVESWRVPLGMHVETRDVSVDWK
ncbi:hypothetical protein [Streptomyces sp. SGAir0957]